MNLILYSDQPEASSDIGNVSELDIVPLVAREMVVFPKPFLFGFMVEARL